MLNDSLQRSQATDPFGSYIVQAPAGSGKTEILTQRYLRLLSGVTAPEQIIALTFTRKAANEMRERILRALQRASDKVQGISQHEQQTLAFAEKALTRDKQLDWQLLNQPGRLRIITIDSLCQSLTQAIPLHEKHLPYAQITDKPQKHYIEAAQACLSFALAHESYHPALKSLLHHVDNRQEVLLTLFAQLLSHRGQWLPLVYQAKAQDKKTFEDALALIEQHELSRLYDSISAQTAQELLSLVRQLVAIRCSDSPLSTMCEFDQLDRLQITELTGIVLTSQNTLRKAFDHHVGLKRGECPDEDYVALKDQSKAILQELNETPDFLAALLRVKDLPDPRYHPEQWEVLQALFTLLPLLAAQLQVLFSQANEVDFTAISEQALFALGQEESPTDLALYLDHHIHHLLVDEFQDTSIQQFELLSKLVQGWLPNDGKTLFVVGDPMQSIYRFRSAEVGLFLRAQHQGIGPIQLTPLELSCNFRSTETIVTWVNQHFQYIFPSLDDMESGAVTFHPSSPIKPADEQSHVMAFQYPSRELEANALIQQVSAELQANPQDQMAILVRSRQQLHHIIRGLRAQNIPFQGVDIDLLAQLPHLRDVWSLTQALLMPSHRLAWLALLRSPLCGLSLKDLLCIATFDKRKSIYFALSQLKQIGDLSEEGYLRAAFVYTILDQALSFRHQQPLVAWINQTLNQLHGEYILDQSQQDDVEQYWLLLERFETHGQLADLSLFNDEFNKLYSQRVEPSQVQIMTIHKSKGLEFDTVFLPGLSTKPPNSHTPLLRWLQLPSQEHGDILLLSPMKAAHHEQCRLYDYLGKLDTQKNSYEAQRLLYVAATRAKKRLYLFDHSDKIGHGSFRYLLKHQEFIQQETVAVEEGEAPALPSLHHLPMNFYQQTPSFTESELTLNTTPITLSNSTARLIGIVAHDLLQWICDHHPASPSDIPWVLSLYQLKSLGFSGIELQQAQQVLKDQLTNLFDDPIGQWIIQPHEREQNEYELLVNHHDELATRIIDRTFFDNSARWIIDFKTGADDSSTEIQHRLQVDGYAKLFFANGETRIQCGLYYLASNRWLAWEYTNT